MKKVTQFVVIFTGFLLIGAGCALLQRPSETNNANNGLNENVNTVNENTNANENDNQATTNTNASNTEIDTSDWLTYTNEEHGFSYRYPNNAELIENKNSSPYPELNFLNHTSVDGTKPEDYQGVTVDFAVTDLDLDSLTQQIEQSDTVPNGVSLAKVGPIQKKTLNQFVVYQGSHATAIGISTNFYYIPLKSNTALFVFYRDNNPDNNRILETIVNTLEMQN